MKSEFYTGYQIRNGYKYTCCQFCQKEWQVCAQRTGWYVCPWCPSYYDYLNAVDHPDCYLHSDATCEKCWNQEWKCDPKPEITHLDAYQIEAMRTCSFQHGEQDKMMRHAVFGLCSESGEVAGILQKVFQGHDFDKEHFKKELGDCLWMIAEACASVGATLSEIASMNIQKLRERYPDGFDPEKSKNRKEGDI